MKRIATMSPNQEFRRTTFRLSLRRLLILLPLAAALFAALILWLSRPKAIEVQIWAEPYTLCRYDDHAGNLPMGALFEVRNVSDSTVWFLGFVGSPTFCSQERINGKWRWHVSHTSMPGGQSGLSQWTKLRSMEAMTILAGVSDNATEIRIGLPFANRRTVRVPYTQFKLGLPIAPDVVTPVDVQWIFSPIATIVKKGENCFAEAREGAKQVIQTSATEVPKE
jgi:hypothetical protein